MVRKMRDRLCDGTRIACALDSHERPAALPPREDDRRRRPPRLRRRDRPDRRERRPLRLEPARRARAGGLARPERPARRADRRGRRRALSDALARGHRRGASRPCDRRSRTATRRRSSSAPCRRTSTRRCRAETSGSSSRTSARSAAPRSSSTSRTSSCGRPRSSRSSARSSCGRPATVSGSSSCSPRSRTRDPTTRAARSPSSSRPMREPGACWRRTLYARHGELSDPVYVHAKVGIVDDALADDRLGEPERPFAVQRHRGERRHPRREARARDAAPPVVRAPRAAGEGDRRRSRPRSSTGYWKPIGADQLERQRAGLPLTHRLVRLPHVSRRSGRLLGPLQGLLVDG